MPEPFAVSVLAVLCLLAAPVRSAPYDQGLSAMEDRLLHAPWEDRLRVVRTLADRGEAGRGLLELAARDSDWQVRVAAAEALGKLGNAGERGLERLAAGDDCVLVRLAAAHQLGRMGGAPPPPEGASDDPSRCASSYLPGENATRARAVKARDSTRPDEAGCLYLRFQRLGRGVCPKGLGVRGIGRPPDSPKLLKVRGEDGGVAYCCPDDGSVSASEPVEVECRLVPEDCPPPWQQMDTPGDAYSGKEGRYRRTDRHAQGDLDWVQCCRPVPVFDGDETAQGDGSSTARAPRARPRPKVIEEEPPEEEPAQPTPERTAGPSPESLIARRAIEIYRPEPETLPAPRAPEPREDRAVESRPKTERPLPVDPIPGLDDRADLGAPQALPGPIGAAAHSEAAVEAPAKTEKAGHPTPAEGLDAKARHGRRDAGLAAPVGPSAREEEAVTGAAALMADAGTKLKDDPLPVLIEKLAAPEAAIRARAAEMIAAMGADGHPAEAALRKALSDASPRVRSNAALALGAVTAGTDAAVPALKRLLKDPHPDVRYSAAAALGRVGTAAAEKAFSRHLRGAAGGLKIKPRP